MLANRLRGVAPTPPWLRAARGRLDGDRVFRTYFINNRGDEQMGSTWNYLDITPLGRQEVWEDSPAGYPQTPPYKWWNWHDGYVAGAAPDKKWVEVSDAGEAAFRNKPASPKP